MRFTFKKTQEVEKRKLLQTKMEELANLTDEIEKSYRRVWGEILKNISSGKYDISVEGVNLPFARMKILITFYFPQLRAEYDALLKERDIFGSRMFPVLRETDRKKGEELFVTLVHRTNRSNRF